MCRLPYLLVVALAVACAADPGPPPDPENAPPRARFRSPSWVQQGADARFDAGDSFDPDGTLISYRFIFGDGSPSTLSGGPVVEHAYEQVGLFTVLLIVTDDDGATHDALHQVGVTLDAPAPCAVDGDCPVGLDCEPDGLCYHHGVGDACANDDDCGGIGVGCFGGACTEPECEADAECGPGTLCRLGLCHPDPNRDGGGG